MVVFSGLKCRKCGTRVAIAVIPQGETFPCPTCQTAMRAQRRARLASAMSWCPHCWTAPRELGTDTCPKCGRQLEPLRLAPGRG